MQIKNLEEEIKKSEMKISEEPMEEVSKEEDELSIKFFYFVLALISCPFFSVSLCLALIQIIEAAHQNEVLRESLILVAIIYSPSILFVFICILVCIKSNIDPFIWEERANS
jgi:hypothetical protein